MTGNRPRILVVDDEYFNIVLLKDLISIADCDVITALNGADALTLAAAAPQPEMILLDVQMPHMDGYEVCEKLKERSVTKDIPVIFVTALADDEDEMHGLALGAVDYITKPIRPAIAMARIRSHLELKLKRDLLQELASIDQLTRISNRRKFDETIEREWRRAVRSKTPVSIVMIDIDYFKLYNDTYGHTVGDKCLVSVAGAIEGALDRDIDMVARFGGEEFVCVLSDTGAEGAMKVAQKILAAVRSLNISHKESATAPIVTISLGVATTVPTFDTDSSDLMKAADTYLYTAKEAGRNRIASA